MICTDSNSSKKANKLSAKFSEELKSPASLIPLTDKRFKISFHWDIESIADEWDEIAPDDLFFSSRYLYVLQKYPMDGFRFCYGMIHENEELIGIQYFQLRHLELKKSLKIHTHKEDIFSKLGTQMKAGLANKINFSTLICGNVLLTGKYGFYFQKDRLDYKKEFALVEESFDLLHAALAKEKLSFGLVLMKDFYTESGFEKQGIEDSGFAEFSVQPNMVMHLDPAWNDFEDYMASIRSKYRVRVKRAFKKAIPINKRKLSQSEIQNYLNDIYRLYKATSEVAVFNLFSLTENYFTELAKAYPDKFEMYGYFLDEELVGFFSYLINGSTLDAHFLGYNPSFNPTYQLYLNMLYDLIHAGIHNDCSQIKFSRTALEIKSSVGAIPMDMYCYLKHRKNFPNVFIRPMLKLMVPEEEWVQRTPFK